MPLVYCGTRLPIPLEYFRQGTPYECLRKGVGVGKYLVPRAPHLNNNVHNNNHYVNVRNLMLPILFLFTVWIVILIFILYF
jgi:hypothetical protein